MALCVNARVCLNVSAHVPALGVRECALVPVSVSFPPRPPPCLCARWSLSAPDSPACVLTVTTPFHSLLLGLPDLTSWRSPESGLLLRGPSPLHIQLSPSWPVFAHFGAEIGGSGLWTPLRPARPEPVGASDFWQLGGAGLLGRHGAPSGCEGQTPSPSLALFLIFIYLKTLCRSGRNFTKSRALGSGLKPLPILSSTKFLTGVCLGVPTASLPGAQWKLAKVLPEAESPFVLRTGHCMLVNRGSLIIANCVEGNMQGHQVFQV